MNIICDLILVVVMEKQISLPPNIFIIYDFFNKTKNKDWDKNPFIFYKKINDINIKVAKDISNLNFYQIDIPILHLCTFKTPT